jgi:hypothetical protein
MRPGPLPETTAVKTSGNPRWAGCFFLMFGLAVVILYSMTIQCMVDANLTLITANHTMSSACRSATSYNPDPWTIAVYAAIDTMTAVVLFGLAFLACTQRRIVKV